MDRPYTKQQVFALEMDADKIGRWLHDPFGAGRQEWRRLDPELLDTIVYDAMVALQNEMLREEY